MSNRRAKTIRKKIKQYDGRIRKDGIREFILYAKSRPVSERLKFCWMILFSRSRVIKW
jgi:hypothetical protein